MRTTHLFIAAIAMFGFLGACSDDSVKPAVDKGVAKEAGKPTEGGAAKEASVGQEAGLPAAKACKFCTADTDCTKGAGNTGVCSATGTCTKCAADKDCTDASLGKFCSNSACVACKADNDCTDKLKGCATSLGFCTCTTDQECKDQYPTFATVTCK